MGGWIVFLLVCFDVDFSFVIVCFSFLDTFPSLLCGSLVVIVDGLLERTCSAASVCICLCVFVSSFACSAFANGGVTYRYPISAASADVSAAGVLLGLMRHPESRKLTSIQFAYPSP